MFLGIEIGGTKLQLGVGKGDGTLVELRRYDVQPEAGAEGIRKQIAVAARELRALHPIERVGFGFGGPLDRLSGVVTTSHQISGWTNFPLRQWCENELQLPCVLGNDCDCATLAEARFGAGRGATRVFYVTVGTGVGGGFAVDGKGDGTLRPAIAEIGHLRPGIDCTEPSETVESMASGWGIVTTVRKSLQADTSIDRTPFGELASLTAKRVAELADKGNPTALDALNLALQVLGWAIAQVTTLLAPEIVVVGGGVSLLGEERFYAPLRHNVDTFVFPPLRGTVEIVAPMLGEEVVVHGALANCADG